MDPRDAPASAGHLILVGLPGAGKTTAGRLLAEQLGIPFLDFDAELERREGRSVSEIFARDGESRFRTLERALTAELVSAPRMVLAPGGGWAASPGVVALLRPPGRIIYLRIRPETALDRLGSARATRPLLAGPDPLGELRRLLEAREGYYLGADHVLDVDVLDPQQVARALLRLAGGAWTG